ncbi:MAG: VOC family protein [Streptococcaceae bacterium]|jgi:lactoylglutathione lyase|nr:VOC family protein [Streptococcaceae bacterium]
MKIEHIGLMVQNLEMMRAFYEKYFSAHAGEKYHNQKTSFQSYFLSFPDGDARLEIGSRDKLTDSGKSDRTGFAHLAVSLGSKKAVDQLTQRLQSDGYTVKSAPRTTGDGYYESVILDPENNEIELTV